MRLIHLVDIQQPTETDNGGGDYEITWSDYAADCPAGFSDPRPYETISAEQAGHRITHTITLRYISGVTSAMRVAHGTRYFYIKTVVNQGESNRWLVLTAEEKS